MQQHFLDRFGNACRILHDNNTFTSPNSCNIRLQDYVDRDLFANTCDSNPHHLRIFSSAEVWNRIKHVEDLLDDTANDGGGANVHKDTSLYRRYWIERDGDMQRRTSKSRTLRRNNSNKPNSSFTVAQFNSLARGLSSGPNALFPTPFPPEDRRIWDGTYGGFTHLSAPEVIMDFGRIRKWRLLQTILGGGVTDDVRTILDDTNPQFDILALEELDEYYSFIRPLLIQRDGAHQMQVDTSSSNNENNYNAVFEPKPNSPCAKFGWYSDGVALLWNANKFETIAREDTSTKQTSEPWIEKGSFSESAKDTSGNDTRNQVFVILPLRIIGTAKILVVGATHLKAKKCTANARVRYIQALELKQRVVQMANQLTKQCNDVSILILGDFNAEPTDQSVQCILEKDETWSFQSAYPLGPENNLYTTWKARKEGAVCRIIDYIFYGTRSETESEGIGLECTNVLSVPSKDEMYELLPGFRYPSDHLLIAAAFHH